MVDEDEDEDEDEDGGEDVLRRGSRVLETAKAAASSKLPMDASGSSCERRRRKSQHVCSFRSVRRSRCPVCGILRTTEAAGMQAEATDCGGGGGGGGDGGGRSTTMAAEGDRRKSD